jgi:hypothetical protein
VCERAEGRECLVFRGRAAEFERAVPFAPVVDALDAYLASLDPGRLRLPEGELRDELGAIFPSLRTDRTPVSGVHDERYRAYRAIHELLERLGGGRRLVIAFDDLHWADEASAELLAALMDKPPQIAMLLVLVTRPGQVPAPLEVALGTVERRQGLERMRLGPLSEEEADAMLSSVEPGVRKRVYELGGGNPFYMEQLARTSAGPGAPALGGELRKLELPPAIASALTEEIARLGESSGSVLRAAAVAGERFEPELVADIAGVDEAAVLGALDDLLDRSATRSSGARSTRGRGAAGAWPRTAPPRRRWPGAVPHPWSAPTTSSTRRSAATSKPPACCERLATRPRIARLPPRRAGSELRSGSCRRTCSATPSDGSFSSGSPPRSAAAETLAAVARRCATRSISCGPTGPPSARAWRPPARRWRHGWAAPTTPAGGCSARATPRATSAPPKR